MGASQRHYPCETLLINFAPLIIAAIFDLRCQNTDNRLFQSLGGDYNQSNRLPAVLLTNRSEFGPPEKRQRENTRC